MSRAGAARDALDETGAELTWDMIEIALSAADAVMFSDGAVERVVEVLIANTGWCECRHNPREKHDVNPPCSTRKQAIDKARDIIAALKDQP